MYLYFDRDGILKEQITTTPPRVGNSNINKIYVYFEDMENTNITGAWCRYKQANGIYTENYYYNDIVTEDIPYNQDRDLKFFHYNKPYKFYIFNIPDIVLSPTGDLEIYSVLFSCWFEINGTQELEPVEERDKIFGLGLVAFAVDPTTATVDQDYNINITQWNELMKMLTGSTDFNDINVLNITFKESDNPTEDGLSMVDNVIYWRGNAIATTNEVVLLTGNQTINGVKTFKENVVVDINTGTPVLKINSYSEGIGNHGTHNLKTKNILENDAEYNIELPNKNGTLLLNDDLKPTILTPATSQATPVTLQGGSATVSIISGSGTYTVPLKTNYTINATISNGSITNIDQETGVISFVGPDGSPTLTWTYSGTPIAFKYNIGSDYNGIYVFTHSYLTMLIPIYSLTENVVYKFTGPGLQDSQGSVINLVHNMMRVENYLTIWSGNTNYPMIAGRTGILAKVKLY